MEESKKLILGFINKHTFFVSCVSVFSCALVFSIYTIGYKSGQNSNKISVHKVKLILNNLKKEPKSSLSELDLKSSVIEERIGGINKRFDDLYVLGGIIITLIGIILASVYIKTENDVKKHLDDTFVQQRGIIDKTLGEAVELVGKIQTEYDLALRFRENQQQGQQPN